VQAFGEPVVAHLDRHLKTTAASSTDDAERRLTAVLDRVLKNDGMHLPVLPANVVAIQRIVGDPSCAISDLVDAVSGDPVMATKLIGVANSPYYATRSPSRSIADAVMRIGLRQTRDVLMAIAVRSKVFRVPGDQRIADEMYRHAIGSAYGARIIAGDLGLDEDTAFLVGLVHDVGKILVHTAAAEVHRSTKGVLVPSPAVVDKMIREIHAPLGALVAETWRLGPTIVEAVLWHHHPSHAQGAARIVARLVQAGDFLAKRVVEGRLDQITEQELATIEMELDEGIIEEFRAASSSFLAFGLGNRSAGRGLPPAALTTSAPPLAQ